MNKLRVKKVAFWWQWWYGDAEGGWLPGSLGTPTGVASYRLIPARGSLALAQPGGLGAWLTLRTAVESARGANLHLPPPFHGPQTTSFCDPTWSPFCGLTQASGCHGAASAGTVLFSLCLLATSQIWTNSEPNCGFGSVLKREKTAKRPRVLKQHEILHQEAWRKAVQIKTPRDQKKIVRVGYLMPRNRT